MQPHEIILAPIQSEKSYAGLGNQRYSLRVDRRATKTQIKWAVESQWNVKVEAVATSRMPAKPKRRGLFKGTRPAYGKAVVTLKAGDSLPIFEGVH